MGMQLDLKKMTFSLVLLRPRDPFFEWLGRILSRRGLVIEQVYFPEENGVWIIPAIGTFDDGDAFCLYLDELKILMVREEMGKFGPEEVDFPSDITVLFCNEMFDFEIRDRAHLAGNL